ncbi:MAG: chorismate lyase [Zetaproteobacteria bacterium]|nr:MAG: chorismate lyase [Zetaproteobacteria bacterium]
MFFGDMEAQQWIPVRDWHPSGIPAAIRAVLGATGSLTRFIERHYGLTLTVHLFDQFLDTPSPEEARLLDCAGQSPVLRRQVALRNGARTMFDAESVLPLEGVSSELMARLEQGRLPLGNLLIDRGASLARSDLSIARFATRDGTRRWARRSIIKSGSGTRALVVECFYDLFWRRIGCPPCAPEEEGSGSSSGR